MRERERSRFSSPLYSIGSFTCKNTLAAAATVAAAATIEEILMTCSQEVARRRDESKGVRERKMTDRFCACRRLKEESEEIDKIHIARKRERERERERREKK